MTSILRYDDDAPLIRFLGLPGTNAHPRIRFGSQVGSTMELDRETIFGMIRQVLREEPDVPPRIAAPRTGGMERDSAELGSLGRELEDDDPMVARSEHLRTTAAVWSRGQFERRQSVTAASSRGRRASVGSSRGRRRSVVSGGDDDGGGGGGVTGQIAVLVCIQMPSEAQSLTAPAEYVAAHSDLDFSGMAWVRATCLDGAPAATARHFIITLSGKRNLLLL